MESPTDSIGFLNDLFTKHGGDFTLKKGMLSPRLEKILEIFNRATVLIQSGNLDDVINIFHSLLEMEPSFGAARINLAIAYIRQNRFEEALKELDMAHNIIPKDPDVHIWKANAFLSGTGDLDSAIREYTSALEDSPGNIPALNSLGGLYVMIRDYESARPLLEQALRDINIIESTYNEPIGEKHTVLHHLGMVYHNDGNFGKAVEYYSNALELEPTSKQTERLLNLAKQGKPLP